MEETGEDERAHGDEGHRTTGPTRAVEYEGYAGV